MVFFDASGLFGGDRLAKLSLMARLHYPYLLAAADDHGRLEISYVQLCGRVYHRFPKTPSERELFGYLQEYSAAFLLFLYEAAGATWGQFDIPERWLPRYKNRASAASPTPGPAFIEWKQQYADLKTAANRANPISSTLFKISPKNLRKDSAEISRELSCVELSRVGKPTTTALTSLEGILTETSERIYARHPAIRRCGPGEVKKQLGAIVSKLPASERTSKLATIDANHAGWCASEQWQKDGGQFAKGLSNWLAPTKGRYDEPAPAVERVNAPDRVPTMAEIAENRRRDEVLVRTLPDQFANLGHRRPA
jgi:hypothetical protein